MLFPLMLRDPKERTSSAFRTRHWKTAIHIISSSCEILHALTMFFDSDVAPRAGQECPTVSKIPMALAASFRHKEKERDKHKDEEKDKVVKKKSKEENDKGADSDTEDAAPNDMVLAATPAGEVQLGTVSHTSGWSWILEEWFCNGFGQRRQHAIEPAANPEAPDYPEAIEPEDASIKSKDQKKKEKLFKKCCCKPKESIGPYELLTKERLMGIYLAVFIYRDLKPLVRGK